MFEDLGINADYLLLAILIALLALLFFNLVMVMKYNQIKDRYRDFMRGSSGKSLEERFLVRFKQIDTLNDRIDDTIDRVKLLEDAKDSSFKKIAIHRYDAFAEMGGKLSYSLCLLNDDNDGFIMTSMHNREGCYTYVKEVIKGNTFVILSEEESQVKEEAMNSIETIQSM
ncbi:MAG: DUF4446 family protein [Lachnospiraceae bacterium]|nr:DUF4446 family protein [Lachnospiraceae bacterium]MBO7631480.1 DUF4446 family protein [Lachnospiraceae bacterium]